MVQQIINELSSQIVPIVVAGVLTVIAKTITVIGDHVIDLIATKKKEAEQRIGVDKAKQIENTALQIWNQVDEDFRISNFVGDTIKAKQEMFSKKLIERVPGLTQDEINYLRQTIAGEINKGKAKLQATNVVSITPQQLQDLQTKAQAFDQLQSTLKTVANPSTPTQ